MLRPRAAASSAATPRAATAARAQVSDTAAIIAQHHADKTTMWQNILAYMQEPHAVSMLRDFRYSVHTAPCTPADDIALAHMRIAPSAILPGLSGVFLTKTISREV